mmetsp:Transcript_50909/g.122358  ORF Transcript_50909/g.122358 Transcript_50909/m.122358 type:complete len:235 (-) Transcript_50909:136-840(-)
MPGRIGSEAAKRRIVHRLVDGVSHTFGHRAVCAGVDGLVVAGVEILELLWPDGLVALKGRVEEGDRRIPVLCDTDERHVGMALDQAHGLLDLLVLGRDQLVPEAVVARQHRHLAAIRAILLQELLDRHPRVEVLLVREHPLHRIARHEREVSEILFPHGHVALWMLRAFEKPRAVAARLGHVELLRLVHLLVAHAASALDELGDVVSAGGAAVAQERDGKALPTPGAVEPAQGH